MLEARAPLVLDVPEDAWFDIELMHKDIRLALAVAADLDALFQVLERMSSRPRRAAA